MPHYWFRPWVLAQHLTSNSLASRDCCTTGEQPKSGTDAPSSESAARQGTGAALNGLRHEAQPRAASPSAWHQQTLSSPPLEGANSAALQQALQQQRQDSSGSSGSAAVQQASQADGAPADYKPFVPPARPGTPGSRYAPRRAAAHHGTNEVAARPLPYDPRGGPPRNGSGRFGRMDPNGQQQPPRRRPLPRREPFESGLMSRRFTERELRPPFSDGHSRSPPWQQQQPPWRQHEDRGVARWRDGGRRRPRDDQSGPLNGWADGRRHTDGFEAQQDRPRPPPKRAAAPRPRPVPPRDTRVHLPDELTVKMLAEKLGVRHRTACVFVGGMSCC